MSILRNRLCSTAAFFTAPDGPAAGPGSSGASSPSSSGSPPAAASSGATNAPSAPQPTPQNRSTTKEDVGADINTDFMSIFDGPQEAQPPKFPGSDAADPITTPPAQATPPAAVPQTPTGAEPAAQPEAQPQVVQPAEPGAGGQPQGQTPQPAGQSPALDPHDPAMLALAVTQNEAATIAHVAQSMFALSQEDAQALETDTIGTIPKLLARGFVKSSVNTLMLMSKLLPELVRRSTEDMRNSQTNEDAFYQMWPQIDRVKYRDLVNRYGVTYRTMNPQTSKEQMMADLGPMIMMAAKIPLTAPAQPAGQPAAAQPGFTPVPGHQQPPTNGVRPPPPSPFQPAVPGPAANTQVELNPWEAMFAPRD